MVCRAMRDWLGAGGENQFWDDASTRCMQYAVYAVHVVFSSRCILYLVLTLDPGMER